MHSTLSFSLATTVPRSNYAFDSRSPAFATSKPINLRFCGLRREAFGFSNLTHSSSSRVRLSSCGHSKKIYASAGNNGTPPKSFDYDLIIIGAGVGGHGAALHAVEKVLSYLSIFFLLNFGDTWL